MRDESPLAQTLHVGMGGLMDTTFSYVRASLFVPLTLKDRVIGMLVLTSREADAFTQHHATLAQAIANQTAIAIENARLYAQAQDLAALEERQKLARELHDSVSQALYGIALGAHTARTLLERDPGQVAKPLDYILALAEAGLAEMRALIFESRPESLETEGLVSALIKQAAALHARHTVPVETELCDEPDLPLKVKQELYRVAQEALHNTIKHARASQVNVRLGRTAEAIILEIRDNGRGFDPLGSFPGHLGLLSMQERVKNLAGVLSIESTPARGRRSVLGSQPARSSKPDTPCLTKATQPQRITDHRDRGQRHGCRREDGRILSQERDERRKDRGRDEDDVIGKGPEEVLLDRVQRGAREGQRCCHTLQIALDQGDIRGLHRDICPRPHRDASIRLHERGSIVDSITSKGDHQALFLFSFFSLYVPGC